MLTKAQKAAFAERYKALESWELHKLSELFVQTGQRDKLQVVTNEIQRREVVS
jgi:hypothetical protein